MNKTKSAPSHRTKTQEARTQGKRAVLSNPREEYCLALLLHYPELKGQTGSLLPDYFASSENREIFLALLQAGDVAALKERLDESIWEHVDTIAGRDIPPLQIEEKYGDCVLRLKESFLRSLAEKRAETLALEREQGGAAAELAWQQEHGLEIEEQLREVLTPKPQRR